MPSLVGSEMCIRDSPRTRSGSPLTSSIPLPVMLRAGQGLPLPSASALCVKLCLTDRVWVNRPKRTSNHERLCIHETAGTPSVTLTVVVTRTLLCNDCRVVRVSLPEPVLGLLFFILGRGCSPGTYVSTYTYLGSRADMRYVRMWYIIPHTKTKISRTRVHACTRARVHTRRLFFWDVSIRNSLRSKNSKRTEYPRWYQLISGPVR